MDALKILGKTFDNEEEKKDENISEEASRMITLNVGGICHQTQIKTLLSIPKTRLSDTAEDSLQTGECEYFFDRLPDLFPYILNFYRTGKLHVPMNLCGPLVKDELDFWKIDDKDIQQCCWVHYISFEETLEMIDKFEHDEYTSKISATIVDKNDPCWKRYRPKLWRALQDPYSSKPATAYAVVSLLVVIISITVFVIETLPYFNALTVHATRSNVTSAELRAEMDIFNDISPYDVLLLVDNSCNIFFFVEFLVKLFAAPSKLKFLSTPLTIIEGICLIPYYVAVAIVFLHHDPIVIFEWIRVLFAFRILRIFRIFILMKHFLALKILIYTIKASTKELALLLLVVLIGMVIFACMEYYMEIFMTDESHFEHIPLAFWWAIVTMSTVGYGDMHPQTGLGYCVGAVCAISGVLVIALSVPAIVNNFTLYYTHAQSRQKLKQRKRKHRKECWNKLANIRRVVSARPNMNGDVRRRVTTLTVDSSEQAPLQRTSSNNRTLREVSFSLEQTRSSENVTPVEYPEDVLKTDVPNENQLYATNSNPVADNAKFNKEGDSPSATNFTVAKTISENSSAVPKDFADTPKDGNSKTKTDLQKKNIKSKAARLVSSAKSTVSRKSAKIGQKGKKPSKSK